MDPPTSPPTLDYASQRSWRDHWIVRRWQTVPAWIIGLVGFAILWIAEPLLERVGGGGFVRDYRHQFDCLICILICAAGSLRRLNFRDFLIMAGLGFLLFAADWHLDTVTKLMPTAVAWLFWPLSKVLPTAAVETALISQRKLAAFFWAFLLSISATCIATIFRHVLALSDSPFDIPWLQLYECRWSYLVSDPLVIVLVWLIIVPLTLRITKTSKPFLRFTLGSAAAVACVLYVLYFQVWMYSLAVRSLKGAGPYHQSEAAALLNFRHSPEDYVALWRALEEADWARPKGYLFQDYRYAAIHYLADPDRQGTVKRLAHMLATKPAARLAGLSADLLLDAKEYDSVPILMRYALLNDDDCIKALTKAKIPQVMLAILRSAVREEAEFGSPGAYTGDFKLMPWTHDDLVSLAGVDVGDHIDPWFDFYDFNEKAMSTPLNAQQAEKTDHVVKAMLKYFKKANLGLNQGLKVSPPNWDVPDVSDLEREIDQYTKRVDDALASRPDSSAPGSLR